MKNTIKKRRLQAELAAAGVLVLCVLLVVLIHIHPGFVRPADAVTPFFILKPDAVTEEVIPNYAGVRRTYTLTIPESNTATATGSYLTVYLRHTIAQYSVDGSALDNDLSEPYGPYIGKTPGNYWVRIPVRPAYAGKTAQITLTPVYDSVRNDEPVFLIITRDMLLTMLELPKDGALLALSIAAIAAGLLLAAMVFAMPLPMPDKRRIFCLGAVTVMAGLWKFCGLPTVPLLLNFRGIQKEIWFTGAASYLLMLVLSLQLLTMMRTDGENRTGMLCFYLSAGIAALLLLLQMMNVVELHQTLIWFGVAMVGLHLISLLGQKPSRSELLWLLPFFLALGVDLLIYLFTGSMRGAPAFLIWIVLNLFVRGFGFVRDAIVRERMLRQQEAELRDAKVQAMMNQIRPHFIYNTLTSIYVLCKDDPERAAQVVSDFTDYLQANFSAISVAELIAFSDELQHTKAYVAVESLRYGEKLSVEYDIKHSAFRLPALTLQPLVENAVKHCLGKGIAPEHILVRTWAEGGGAVITVEDDGPGYDASEADIGEEHVGLQNVRERLEMMCSGTLNIAPRPGGGTVATVHIPDIAAKNQAKRR